MLVALVLALLFAACGGGESNITEERARAIASAALLTSADLPAADWQSEERSDGSLLGALAENPGEAGGDIPECAELRRVTQSAARTGEDARPLADAARLLTSEGAQLSTRAVVTSASVFGEEQQARDAHEALRQALTPSSLEPCIRAAFARAEDLGLEVSTLALTTPEHALGEAAAVRALVEAQAGPFPVRFVLELYAVQREHTVAVLGWAELNSDVVAGRPSEVLRAWDERVRAAQDAAAGG